MGFTFGYSHLMADTIHTRRPVDPLIIMPPSENPIQNPATAPWGLRISEADFAKLKRGFLPRDMDDRWAFVLMTDEELAEAATTNGTSTNAGSTLEIREPTSPTHHRIMSDDELDEAMAEMERDAAAAAAGEEAPVDLTQGGHVSIRRSWTDTEFYRLALQPSEGGATIETITWERVQVTDISEEQAKIDAVLLCKSILGCELAAAPDYESAQFSALRQHGED